MGEWFCEVAGVIQGPLTWDELTYLASRGKIKADDQVRRGSSGAWNAAGSVAGLLKRPSTSAKGAKPPEIDARPATKSLLPVPVSAQRNTTERSELDSGLQGTVGSAIPLINTLSKNRGAHESGSPNPWRRRRLLLSAIALVVAALCLLLFIFLPTSGTGGGPGTSAQSTNSGQDNGPDQGQGESVPENKVPTESSKQVEPAPTASNTSGPDLAKPPKRNSVSPDSESVASSTTSASSSRFSVGGNDFFGLTVHGSSVVYVIDCSGSMNGEPFKKAKQELIRSIKHLETDKQAYVIFFSDTHYSMFFPDASQPHLLQASSENKERICDWIDHFQVRGGTDPDSAIELALDLKPDTVFLLTDGAIPPSTVGTTKQRNASVIPINTIGFQNRGGERELKQIASDSGGDYRYVP